MSLRFFFIMFSVFCLRFFAHSQVPTSNLLYWFKCDSFLVMDNADRVLSWKNAIDTNFVLSNSNINNSPTYSNSAIHFDGIDDYLTVTFPHINQPVSYVVLWKGLNLPSAQIVIDGVDPSNRASLIYYSNTSVGIYSGVSLVNYPKPSFVHPIITTAIFDNQNSAIYENGTMRFQNQDAGPDGLNGIMLGLRNDMVFPLFGEISEILLYDKVLNTFEIDSINSYLIDKYSKPVDLGQDISISGTFCDTLLTTSGEFDSYIWSTGAITSSITVNQSGKYWLQAIDGFGRVSSDTILVNFPTINLPSQNAFCTNDTIVWNTGLSKSLFAFQWQDNSTDSLIKIYSAGSYSLQITDTLGCFISTNSISITEDSFSSSTSLGPDTNLCAGNSIALITPTTNVSSYSWSTGATTSAITVTNTGQYSVVVTNTNNCVAKDTIQVNIIGQAPTADFNNTVSCKNQVVNFNDNSSPPSTNTITSWYWNYGDNSTLADTSHLQNSFYTYADTGVYSVSLIVETNVGCKQQFIKTIHVAPVPTASFAIPAVACQNDSVLFLNQSSNLPGYNMSAYNWNFGDLGTSSAVSPKHLYSNNQNYTVKLLTTNNAGCKDSIYKVVSVKAEVKADFTTLKACTNSPTLFQSTSTAPSGATYLWNFGNSFSNIANPSKLYTNSGVYSVKLDVDGGNGCTSSITKFINVYLPPLVSFSASAFCAKDTIQIANTTIAQSGVVASSNWRLNGTSFSTGQTPTLSIVSPATYTVLLSTINRFGCAVSASQKLNV